MTAAVPNRHPHLPSHLRFQSDDGVLKISPAPWTPFVFWGIGAIGAGIPAILVLLFRSIESVLAGAAFFCVILAIAISRFRASRNVVLDLPGQRITLSHSNPRLAQRFGIADKVMPLHAVKGLHLTGLLDGRRHAAPGVRINLALMDCSSLPIIDFPIASEGLKFAEFLAATMSKPVEKGQFRDK